MSAAEPVLCIEGLEKSFPGHLSIGTTAVLRGLDVVVQRGEIYGFLGANGAGKTTTIKIVTGLIAPGAGRVALFGVPGNTPASRRGVGYLPEQPNFYPYLTGRELLDFHARLLGLPRAARLTEIDRLIEEVGMAGRAEVPLRKCSKGMVQRLGIAQALLGSPELLILDEPMSGLDPAGRRDVRNLILAQREKGTTVFFSSHILSDAEVLCDRVGILRDGRLISEGRLETLLGGKEHAWELAVTAGPGALTDDLSSLVVSRQGERVLLHVDGSSVLAATLQSLQAAGATLHSVLPQRDSLEERFLDLVASPALPPPGRSAPGGHTPTKTPPTAGAPESRP